jgi:hypothetical protein
MRDLRALVQRRLGGPDFHAAVDLRRVDRDDLAVELRASVMASALLPDAVGPIRRMAEELDLTAHA